MSIADDTHAHEGQTPRRPFRRVVISLIKIALAAVVLYFAGRQLVTNWADIKQYEWTISWPLLFVSILLHLATFVILSNTWCILMKAFGHQVSKLHGFKVSYISNLGRYVPGKIWPVFGLVHYTGRINVSKGTAVASWAVGTLLGLPPAFLAGFIAISLYPQMLSNRLGIDLGAAPVLVLFLIVAALIVTALVPDSLLRIFNWLLEKFRRPAVPFELNISIILKAYLFYFISWVSYGFAFYVFMHSIMADPPVPIVAGIGSFVTAYIMGYLALFAPGGLGAREWVLTTVLIPFLGPVAAGVAIAARGWNLVTEIIAFLIAAKIKMDKQ